MELTARDNVQHPAQPPAKRMRLQYKCHELEKGIIAQETDPCTSEIG